MFKKISLNSFSFSNLFRILVSIFLLVILFQTASLIFSPAPDTSLQTEIKNIKNDFKQLSANFESLQQDLTSIKNSLSRSRLSSPPIFPTQLTSDDSSSDDPFLGPQNASVIMMYFTDYQCSPCRKFYQSTFNKLKEDFINPGKIKFILRDFPLNTNKYAIDSAALASCAGEQGQYWEMHNAIFENQALVDSGQLLEISKNLKTIDAKKLEQCFKSSRYNKEITKDIDEATQLGVQGAPSFLISKNAPLPQTATIIRGNQPYTVIKEQLQEYLTHSN